MSSNCTSIKPDQYCIEQWKIDLILKTFHAYYGQLVWLGWRPVKTLKLHSYRRKQYTIAWIEAFGALHKCRQINLYFLIQYASCAVASCAVDSYCQLFSYTATGYPTASYAAAIYAKASYAIVSQQVASLCSGELRGSQFMRLLVMWQLQWTPKFVLIWNKIKFESTFDKYQANLGCPFKGRLISFTDQLSMF